MKKILFCVFTLTVISLCAFSADAMYFRSTIGYKPGELTAEINDGSPPYEVLMSYDNDSYSTVISGLINNSFTISGLANGTSYWFKVIDSNGESDIKKYTTPYITIQNNQLTITEVDDTTALCTWAWLDSANGATLNIYENGTQLYGRYIPSTVTQWTFTDLKPNTEYKAFLSSASGYVTNIVTFTTTDKMNTYFDKLDKLLKSLFMPETNVDSDSDGIADPYDKLADSWNQVSNYGPIGAAKQAAQIIKDASNIQVGESELPNFEIEIIKGQKIKVFNWEPWMKQIEIFRLIMDAVVWLTFFFFLIKSMIPNFKV